MVYLLLTKQYTAVMIRRIKNKTVKTIAAMAAEEIPSSIRCVAGRKEFHISISINSIVIEKQLF